MIGNLIAWSARNLLLVFFATALASFGGLYALRTLPLDAIPDLSDVQVIVLTDYPGQVPQVVEDQVTYPLTTAMLTVPKSKVVRGFPSSAFRSSTSSSRTAPIPTGREAGCSNISTLPRAGCPTASRLRSGPMPPESAGSINTQWSPRN
jgi:hypothetical protein